jgi:hypothetical protein
VYVVLPRWNFLRVLLAFGLLLLGPPSSYAAIGGSLSGAVSDPTGAVVAGAKVEVRLLEGSGGAN